MAAAINPDFGAILRRYRSDVGLTQEELAECARLSRRGIAALERGERLRPHPETVRLLADALQLDDAQRAHFELAARSRARPAGETPAPPLIGRQYEMQALLQPLSSRGPPVVLVAGEPGIGKSHLLQEAATRAARAGWVVLWGGCQRQSIEDPYAPIVQALAQHVARRTPSQVRTALQAAPGWCACFRNCSRSRSRRYLLVRFRLSRSDA